MAFNEGRTPLAEQLPGFNVAGFAPAQQTAMNAAIGQGIGAFDPYLTSANQAVGQAYGTTGEAANVLRGADTRNQYGEAQNVLSAGIGALAQGGGQYDPGMAAQFMNPYQAMVTQQALAEMRRQGDIARQGTAAQAVRAGAFGGTREGVQRAEMERGLQDVMAQRIMQDYAQNYAQAQQAGMGTFEAAKQRQLALGQGLGQAASNIGALAGQEFGQGQQIASGLGQIGAQMGQLGIQQGALGQTAQAMRQGDINFLYNVGQSQQAMNQQQLDAQRATELQKVYSPYQQAAFLSDIYKGAPSTQMSTAAVSQPSASPFQQALGVGLGVVSTAAGAKKAGLF
ncbi:MAG: hypothetical protein EBR17_09440 [Betaproteobacteria bacterium]|nr:hypothetical protein [Betaproteobacteria bacterium]